MTERQQEYVAVGTLAAALVGALVLAHKAGPSGTTQPPPISTDLIYSRPPSAQSPYAQPTTRTGAATSPYATPTDRTGASSTTSTTSTTLPPCPPVFRIGRDIPGVTCYAVPGLV